MATYNPMYYLDEAANFLKKPAQNVWQNLTAPGNTQGLAYEDQIAALDDRQKLADQLQAQADQPFNIQSYKGIQAPISGYEGAAKMLSAALAGWEGGGIAGERRAATKAEKAAIQSGFADIFKRGDLVEQGAQQPDDAEGIPQYAANTQVGGGKYILTPEAQQRRLIGLVGDHPGAAGQANLYSNLIGDERKRAEDLSDANLESQRRIDAAALVQEGLDRRYTPPTPTDTRTQYERIIAARNNFPPGSKEYEEYQKQLDKLNYMQPSPNGDTGGPFGGRSMAAQYMNIIIKGDASSPEYALAFNTLSKPRIELDQVTMRPVTIPGMDMSQFSKPSGPVVPGATGITPVVGPAIGETKDIKDAKVTLKVFDTQATNLEDALKGYSASDKTLYATTGIAKGGAATAIGAYNAMVTIIRDPQLINTGVLQQGELSWLNNFLFNPGTIKGMLSGDKATIDSFKEMRGIIANRLKAKQEVYGAGPATPGSSGAGDKYKNKYDDAPVADVGPTIGTVKGGYKFMGGNPADKNSWTKVNP